MIKVSVAALCIVTVVLGPGRAAAQQVTRIPAADRVIAGAPVNQFSIGAEDGEDWELLSRVGQVAFDDAENLYVLDGGNTRVLVFDPRGKFVRKIGKKGGGPGELMSPVGLAITKDGYIAVTDLGRPGVSLFKKDGTFVKNLLMGDSVGFPTPTNGTVAHPRAGLVVRANPIIGSFRADAGGPIAPPTMPRKSPLTWLDASGKMTGLYTIQLPPIAPKISDSGAGSGERQVMVRISPPAFTPQILWTVLPDGSVAVAEEDDYRIKIASNGKVQRIIERPFAPRKATERDKDRARDARRRAMKTGAGMTVSFRDNGPGGNRSSVSSGAQAPRRSDAEIEQSVREMTFLETIPVLQNLRLDARGRMWVQRNGREFGTDGPIDIIDATGRYVGTVNGKLPDAISRTGRAAYIERDDMDVEKVVVRKLPAGWL